MINNLTRNRIQANRVVVLNATASVKYAKVIWVAGCSIFAVTPDGGEASGRSNMISLMFWSNILYPECGPQTAQEPLRCSDESVE